jgi:translation initiation factor 2 beta subunit (eIF-2beta)/eIF-5
VDFNQYILPLPLKNYLTEFGADMSNVTHYSLNAARELYRQYSHFYHIDDIEFSKAVIHCLEKAKDEIHFKFLLKDTIEENKRLILADQNISRDMVERKLRELLRCYSLCIKTNDVEVNFDRMQGSILAYCELLGYDQEKMRDDLERMHSHRLKSGF